MLHGIIRKLGHELTFDSRTARDWWLCNGEWIRGDARLRDRIRDDVNAYMQHRKLDSFGRVDKFKRLTVDGWNSQVNALMHDNESDFFITKWLNTVPEWDGIKRIDDLVPRLFGDDSRLAQWAGKYLLLGAVTRTYNPGTKMDEIPVIVGPQGIGKSTSYDTYCL